MVRRADYRDKELNELLLVVDNNTFEKIPTPETYMDIIELNKTYI